jgi:hypothetical protein
MTKTLKVSEDTYWKLKALAVEKRVSMGALVGEVVEALGTTVVVKNPTEGWRQKATTTSPAPRPTPKQQKAASADSEQAKVERMKAALAAMPVKAPIDPKNVHADKAARVAVAVEDDDDVAY